MYHRKLIFLDSDAKYQSIVMYGQEVQGSKNKLITNPVKNAHIGETMDFIVFCSLGLRDNGTSIINPLPYRKKSFKFASHTIIPSIQTIRLMSIVLPAVARAENRPSHIAK